MTNATKDPMTFINEWNSDSQRRTDKVFLRPEAQDNQLYNVEVRFCGQVHRTGLDEYTQLCNRIFTVSKGIMHVTSLAGDFTAGILRIAVLFCNHGYSDRIVVDTLDFLVDEALPGLAK